MDEINKIKKVATSAAKEAGAELLKRYIKFSRKDIKLKSHHEIVTAADLAAEKIIIRHIKSSFPEHKFLSEESGKGGHSSDYYWIIDPLDGTTNFSMHNPLWAVSIGVTFQKEVVFGVVFAPVLNELFTAALADGAKMNGKKIGVSTVNKGKVLNTFCHSNKEKDIKRAIKYYQKQKLGGLDCRQLGSASIELAYVAAGRIESIVIPGANTWDVAGGTILVKEAGGRVTDFKNNDWNIISPDMAASNGLVHEQIMGVLS